MPNPESRARIVITGDTTGAVAQLGEFGKSLRAQSAGIRELASGIRGFGVFMALSAVAQQGQQIVAFNGAVDQAARVLNLTGAQAEAFRARIAALNATAISAGIQQEDFSAAILQVSRDANMMRGDLDPTTAAVALMTQAMHLAADGAGGLAQNADAITQILYAYNLTAADSARVADYLDLAFKATNETAPELANQIASIGTASKGIKPDLAEVISLITSGGPAAAQLAKDLVDLVQAAKAGDPDAVKALRLIGKTVDDFPGQIPLVKLIGDVNAAAAQSPAKFLAFKNAASGFVKEDDLKTLERLRDDLQKIVDLKTQVAADPTAPGGSTLDKSFKQAQSDKSAGKILGELYQSNARGNDTFNPLAGAATGIQFGSWLLKNRVGPWLFDPESQITTHADGGIVTRPHLGMVGEAGPEAIIPLSGARGRAALGAMGGGTAIHVQNLSLPGVKNAGDFVAELKRMSRDAEFQDQYGALGARRTRK